MSIKDRARAAVAARHGQPIAGALASVARKYLHAYENLVAWNMTYNGELRALREIIAVVEGDVLDVGANVGQWVSAVLPFVGDRQIHSFEPIPPVFAILERITGGFPNIRLNMMGLGQIDNDIQMHYSSSASDLSSRYALIYGQKDERIVTCHIGVGDDYIRTHSIERVSVLKIDVEGMEAEVLAGFEDAFRANRIATVQFEHGESHVLSGHTLKHFIDYFDERGFDVVAVMPNRLMRYRYMPYRETYVGQNFYAVRRDILPLLQIG